MKKASFYLTAVLLAAITFTSCGGRKKAVVKDTLTFNQRAQFDEIYFKASKQKVLGNYIEAAKHFADALKIDPNSHAVMYQLANINMAVSGFHDAVYWSEKAMLASPGFNYWYAGQLAQAYSKVGQFEKSAKVFELMIAEDPDRSMNYQEASKQYINAKLYKKSYDVLTNYVKRFGIDEDVARLLEGLSFQLGKNKEAISWMQKLVDSNPGEIRYKGLLAETYGRNNQLDKAKDLYNEILISNPDNGYAHFGLSDIYKKEKQEDSSFYHLERGFNDANVPLSLKMKVIGSFFPYMRSSESMRSKALSLAEIIVEVHNTEEKAYLLYADVLHASGKYKEARQSLLRAIEINPAEIAIWQKLLSIDDDQKDYPSIISDSKMAMEYFPNQPFLYIINSFAHFMSENYNEAIASAEEGMEIALLPTDKIDLMTTIGDASYSSGQYEKCFETYDELLEIAPKNAGILNNYAYYLSEQKLRLSEALEMINKALGIEPNEVIYIDTKGWVLYQLGDYENALIELQKAYDQMADDEEVANHYADCLIKLGRAEEGKKIKDKFL